METIAGRIISQQLTTSSTHATTNVAVLNQGIGGGGIFGGLGPLGNRALRPGCIGQSGVRWMIVFEGVNDIGGDSNGTIGTSLIAAYKQLITKAHARNMLAYGATITPIRGQQLLLRQP